MWIRCLMVILKNLLRLKRCCKQLCLSTGGEEYLLRIFNMQEIIDVSLLLIRLSLI